MKLAFLGTPRFAVPSLEGLVAAGHDVRLVITQPDRPAGRGRELVAPPVKQAAERLGLTVFQPERLRDQLDRLRAADVNAAVVAAYGEVLTAQTLAVPPLGLVNVHPSLLPRLRGATPVPTAILEGLSVTGVTVMQVGVGVDSGPILAQVGEPIRPEDTGESLLARLSELGADLLVETLPRFEAGEIVPRRQVHAEATYSRQLRREDGLVDWSLPAVELWRRCRAFQPWPGCHTTLGGKSLKLLETAPLVSRQGHAPGTVFETKSGLAAACGTGALLLRRVQAEGRKPMAADEFARGQPTFRGTVLGV
jgi:methionyl-tRNA formyltransferase